MAKMVLMGFYSGIPEMRSKIALNESYATIFCISFNSEYNIKSTYHIMVVSFEKKKLIKYGKIDLFRKKLQCVAHIVCYSTNKC